MNGSYDDVAVVESREHDWIEVVQRITWRAASEGRRLDASMLEASLEMELGISRQAAKGWVAGVGRLTEYATQAVIAGDALSDLPPL